MPHIDFTGWDLANQAFQQQLDQEANDKLAALVTLGVDIEAAKLLSGYNNNLHVDFRNLLKIRVARSDARVNSDLLEDGILDTGVLYAVFIPDIPDLSISQITFYLDAVVHHTEFSVPWDYDGTAVGGEANRVTFAVGQHTIQADVTDGTGFFSIFATFEVE